MIPERERARACRRPVPERVPALPHPANRGQGPAAVVRRRSLGLDDLSVLLSGPAPGRLCVRTFRGTAASSTPGWRVPDVAGRHPDTDSDRGQRALEASGRSGSSLADPCDPGPGGWSTLSVPRDDDAPDAA